MESLSCTFLLMLHLFLWLCLSSVTPLPFLDHQHEAVDDHVASEACPVLAQMKNSLESVVGNFCQGGAPDLSNPCVSSTENVLRSCLDADAKDLDLIQCLENIVQVN